MYQYDDYSSRKEYSEEELIYTELIYEDDFPPSIFSRLGFLNADRKKNAYAPNRKVMPKLTLLSIILLLSTALAACGSSKVAGTVFSLDELPGKNVGVILNSLADVEATDLEVGSDDSDPSYVIRYESLEEGLEDLENGELDCMILEDFQANSCLEDYEDLMVLDESFSYQDYTICLGEGSTELRDEINGVITEMKNDGTLDKIDQEFTDPEAVLATAHSNETTSVDDNTLIVATSAGYSPYCYTDSEGNLAGIDIETAYAIGDRLGKTIYLVNMDYESIFDSLKEGTVDIAIAGIEMTEDLDGDFNCIHTDSYANAVQTVLARTK